MITRENILDLAKKESDQCVSIYLPTHKAGEEVQQDPIRLKNLLTQAVEQLKDREVRGKEIDELLDEARKLLDNPQFWRHNDKGLALFISDEDFEYYRIPHAFKERVMVDDHFLITPLVPMITLEGTFCILALSQKKMRLLKCTRASVEEVELEEAPKSLEEFLKYDVNETNLQHHAGQGANAQAIFHGQGGSRDTNTEEIINYLKTVENEVTSILRKRNDPLILGGVNEAIAEYRKVNSYSRLLDQTVSGNPDPKSNEEIKDEGWKVIKSYFLKGMYEDIERFGDLSGSEKQSDNLSQIVEAAYYGKVESLFVPIGEHSWGWFDMERDTVHHSAEPQNGEHDLINMAAIKTLTQSGNVYALDKEDMPNGSSIAAIFRYA
ncbi:baeRF7 domain-containing protein [Fodinibius sp. AD559]|uniref:baeRF7 domain-containing protein n=1 Tax=Fodinibius sp. AD559 TaxID=3424179 RepID=UPI004046E2E3